MIVGVLVVVVVLVALWIGRREGATEKKQAEPRIRGLDYDCGNGYLAKCDKKPIRIRNSGECIKKCESKGYVWSMIARCFFRCVMPKEKTEPKCRFSGDTWASGRNVCLAPW